MKTKLHRAITALLFALCGILSASAAEKPNVLLIMADDLCDFGWAFTRDVAKTPNLDRRAARGVRYERAFPQLLRQGGWTAHSFGKILHSANTGETQRETRLEIVKSRDKSQVVPLTATKREGRNLTGGKPCSLWQTRTGRRDR